MADQDFSTRPAIASTAAGDLLYVFRPADGASADKKMDSDAYQNEVVNILQSGTLAQFSPTTSAQLAGAISDETGSGFLVFNNAPTLVAPVLGAATATSINKITITSPAGSATLTIADGATLTASATADVSGTNTGDQTAATVAFTPDGDISATDVQAAIVEVRDETDAKIAANDGTANLTYTPSATDGTVTSSTGTNATLPAGSAVNASLMLPGDKTKLDGIEAGAKDDQTAAEVVFSPDGDISAVQVQAAIVEVRDDTDTKLAGKANSSHTHATADVISGTFADARISESSVTQHDAAIDHDGLLNYVIAQHRIINDAGSSTTELMSASKILDLTSAAATGGERKGNVVTDTKGLGNITLSGEQTLNGVTTSASRIVVVEQTNGEDNGSYLTDAGAWTRTADADTSAEVNNGMIVYVEDASATHFQSSFILVTANPITLDTTPLVFDEIPPANTFGTTSGTATEGDDTRVPTQDENDALDGTGTPSAGNPFVTDDDSRLTDSRTPTAHAASHQDGGSDEIATATPAANAIPKATAGSTLNTWISDATTSVKGLAELATDGENAANVVVQGNDARLADDRTPTSHAATHQHLGSDEIATATPAANAIPKATAGSVLDSWISDATTSLKGKVELATDGENAANVAVQGNDSRLSNARTPTAHALGGAEHSADTLANLNTKISDATLGGLDTVNAYTKQQNFSIFTLTDAANISWDLDDAQTAQVTLTANRILDIATNIVAGGTYVLYVIQGGAGGFTLDTSAYRTPDGVSIIIAASAAGEYDIITFVSKDGANMDAVAQPNFS